MEQRNFYEAKAHLYEFYGIDMEDEVFESIALHAWDKINNKAYRFYKFSGKIKNNRLSLPCNADIIEYVQGNGESRSTSSSVTNFNAYNESSIIEESIENYKSNQSAYYGRGHYLEYVREGDDLVFPQDNITVTVLYKGVVLDADGLPKLNYKEIEAVAKYCAFVDSQRKAMITKDKGTFEIAMMMKQEWNVACASARTPIYFSQNDMDRILDVQSSWDRKSFGKSFKVLR